MGSACYSKRSIQTVPLLNFHPTPTPLTRFPSQMRSSRSIFSCTEDSETTFHEMAVNSRSAHPMRWKRGNLIGEGAYAKVYQCLNLDTGELVAAKHFEVSRRQFSEDPRRVRKEFESLKREIGVLKELQHPNVVKYLQADISQEQDSIDILMEYVPEGCIRKLVAQYRGLDEPVIATLARQLLRGLSYIHERGIVHRDLKCANLLLTASGLVKITDFGASKRLTGDFKLTKSLRGSPFWMAPEVVSKRGHNSAADIWSLGCVLIEMATGHAPWSDISHDASEVLKLISRPGSKCHSDLPKIPFKSAAFTSFVKSCLQRSPDARPTAQQLLDHPFVSDISDPVDYGQNKTEVMETPLLREDLSKGTYSSH